MNKLILGSAQLGMNYGINNSFGQINVADAMKILTFAYENGITFIDTAPIYGNAHKVIGDFHRLNENSKFKIITKIPSNFNFQNIDSLVDEFLNELNVEKIEVLHFHSFMDYIKLERDFLKEFINRLKKSGKVESLGVSIYSNFEVDDLLKDNLIDIVQLPFNLLDNNNLRMESINNLRNSGKIIHSRSAFLQGLFFLKISEIKNFEIKTLIIKLNEICIENDITMEELALQYCLTQESIDYVLIGVDSLSQLIRNIKISKNIISKTVVNQIEEIIISDPLLINPNKWSIK